MIDVNERAVELSNENAEQNGITNVKIYQSDLFSNVDSAQTFASILTNPPIRAGKSCPCYLWEKRWTLKSFRWIVDRHTEKARRAFCHWKARGTVRWSFRRSKKERLLYHKSKKSLTRYFNYVNIVKCQCIYFAWYDELSISMYKLYKYGNANKIGICFWMWFS